jgi:hypothetical protein
MSVARSLPKDAFGVAVGDLLAVARAQARNRPGRWQRNSSKAAAEVDRWVAVTEFSGSVK